MKAAAAIGLVAAFAAGPFGGALAACLPAATWVAPGAPAQPLQAGGLLASLAQRKVVLLGEAHDSAEHHRWQLHTIAALHGLRSNLVLGFESFPRRVQPALDRWVAGELGENAFLAAVDWRNVWGMDPQLYLPLFHFARQKRIPMVALNVDKAFTRAVRANGFDAVDVARREGVTRPAPPHEKYVDFLYPIFLEHESAQQSDGAKPGRESAQFRRFLESQTTWDRAMAQAIAGALAARPGALVVGIAGRNHVAHGYGVPHQLADLGMRDVSVLLPWDSADCAGLTSDIAEAVFGLPQLPAEQAKRPRLGVRVETATSGVTISFVEKGSVAEAAGLREGDVVVEVAGRPAKVAADVVEAVARQAPGTWLPIGVARKEGPTEVVAKFPPLAN